MIGDVKLTYDSQDLIRLVKNDIIYKFGQRELASFDLSTPGVFTTLAKVQNYPNPEVLYKSIEQQIAEFDLPSKPPVPRADSSITRDPTVGGDNILFAYDRRTGATFAGGPVKWSQPEDIQQSGAAHWVAMKIAAPLGITLNEGQLIPYVLNGVPKVLAVDAIIAENNTVVMYFNAALTTHSLTINWDSAYEPETIPVHIPATLENSAVVKTPAWPTEPIITFKYPEQSTAAASISVEVDLAAGK